MVRWVNSHGTMAKIPWYDDRTYRTDRTENKNHGDGIQYTDGPIGHRKFAIRLISDQLQMVNCR